MSIIADTTTIAVYDHSVGLPPSAGAVTVDPVVTGRDTWLGAKATVVRSDRIGGGAIVATSAVANVVRMLDT